MYLGLDLGTSGLRALLMDADQVVIGVTEAAFEVSHPKAGWSEQNPQDWITAAKAAIAALRRDHLRNFTALRAIGLSGHMHGATLLDATDAVLRPCILWNDTRAHAEAATLDAIPALRAQSGNIVFPGFTAPKLLWVQRHEPRIFEATAKVLLPKDYLRLWLTGGHVSEMSDSAGTSWLNTGERAWSDDLLRAGHMRRDQMPDLIEGTGVSGELRSALANDWGLSHVVRVMGGGGDNAAAACGAGCHTEGDGFISLGTSGVLLAAKDAYTPRPQSALHTFCHAVPDRWYQMGVTLAAGDSLNWLARITGTRVAELASGLGQAAKGPSGVRFLPYLSGERTPHNDSAIRGAFLNLDVASGPQDLAQAVMEGVAFALADSLSALRDSGTDLHRLLAIGGGAQSSFWESTIANVLGLPIDLPAKGEFGAALGAARIALVGDTGADPAGVMTKPPVMRTLSPDPDLAAAYAAAQAQYRAAYPALKALP